MNVVCPGIDSREAGGYVVAGAKGRGWAGVNLQGQGEDFDSGALFPNIQNECVECLAFVLREVVIDPVAFAAAFQAADQAQPFFDFGPQRGQCIKRIGRGLVVENRHELSL